VRGPHLIPLGGVGGVDVLDGEVTHHDPLEVPDLRRFADRTVPCVAALSEKPMA
jgi:hypothetical protein